MTTERQKEFKKKMADTSDVFPTREQAEFEQQLAEVVDLNVATDAVVEPPSIASMLADLTSKEKEPMIDPTVIAAAPPQKLIEGYKADDYKVRYDLLPPEFLHATSVVLTFGASKYADRNWEKGLRYGRVFGGLMRHLWAWWGGKASTNKSFVFGELDPETNYSHLWHASCCLAFLITYEARGMSKFDDRSTGVVAE